MFFNMFERMCKRFEHTGQPKWKHSANIAPGKNNK